MVDVLARIFSGWWLCLLRLSRMLCSLGRVLHLAVHLFGGAFSLQMHTQFVRFEKHPSFLYSKPLNSKLNEFLWFRTNSNGALSIHLTSGNSEIHYYVWKDVAHENCNKFSLEIIYNLIRLNDYVCVQTKLKKKITFGLFGFFIGLSFFFFLKWTLHYMYFTFIE